MNFTCPYCDRETTITSPNYSKKQTVIDTRKSEEPYISLQHEAMACPNPDCKKLSLHVSLARHSDAHYSNYDFKILQEWQLLPKSLAKPQPDYVPLAIRNDYYEACTILHSSPKASATLSRRCLQGIVRDFWQLESGQRGNLGAELNVIQEKIDSDTWAGINAIRSVGDIGAHMEKDVNFVVDVEKEEAELLIELIEMLFSDWYVGRQKRKERADRAKKLSQRKLTEKREAKTKSRAEN